uniref:Adenine phosphoribosyl transferase n=1 Tax=Mus musculus TaxID=10090 RepID=A0A1D5RM31_MOUSE
MGRLSWKSRKMPWNPGREWSLWMTSWPQEEPCLRPVTCCTSSGLKWWSV